MVPSNNHNAVFVKMHERNKSMQKTHDATVTKQCECSLTYEFELPWPSPTLSPNARPHWALLAKTKKSYRARCRVLGLQAGLGTIKADSQRLSVHLDFYPPDRRARDWDNMVASMKAGLDGLADAMGVDDSRWRLSFEICDETATGGRVVVMVEVRV